MVDGGSATAFVSFQLYYSMCFSLCTIPVVDVDQNAVAKEQGLRSRAAFKLSQINRKFPVLEKAKGAVLDLCAAPGGWTQIAARTCPSTVQIVAVDILPIRSIGHRNVTTLVGDITTDKCKSEIQRTLSSSAQQPVDVVLHDGAPNVGADYAKDAYVQNELALHALKCATQHLTRGGTFITKIYRSRDYAAYHWVLQQLFDTVTAFKPTASRQASAEIFLICTDYKAPLKLDPRLLDPKHVFESVEGETTGGAASNKSQTVFDKSWDKPVRRRGGYDMQHLDATMRHIEPVSTFVTSGLKDAIQMLSSSTGLSFTCEQCTPLDDNKEKAECQCSFLLHHPFTTTEIKECVADLQVLNKSDFKGLLGWRTKMQDALKAIKEGDSDHDEDDASQAGSQDDSEDSDKEEAEIQKEMEEMRARRQRDRKRQKKKERAVAAKRRKQAALGIDLNAIDIPDHDKIFSLASITSAGALEAVSEVNLDQVTDEQIFGGSDDDEDIVVGGNGSDADSDDDSVDEEARRLKRERDLDEAYNQYLESTRDGIAVSGTKMAKRSKKHERQKALDEAEEDTEMALTGAAAVSYDAKTYAKMLQGAPDSDDDDDDEGSSEGDEDDGFNADPMTPAEYAAAKKETNPLIHKFADEATSVKTARWFSNPLFASIGKSVESATVTGKKAEVDDVMSESDSDEDSKPKIKKRRVTEKKLDNSVLTAEDVLASMPRTDKQIRHDKRLKQMERDERKKVRRAKKLGDTESEFQLVAGNASDSDEDDEANRKLDHLSDAQKKRVLEARDLIKAGLGQAAADDSNVKTGIEIVSQVDSMAAGKRPLPIMDERKFNSDHEDYDSDDYAQTLALGTMMLRRSKEKAFVDASYNRYAWNDPSDLPEWFVDDENKHYRPQLPVPPALLAKMKEKMMALSAKPIAKVAEARARKSKRAKTKLAAAKKQAEAVANSTEMSESMKLKAISKALQGQDNKRPGKKYVVAKKGRGNVGVKGAKLVDKRLKSDKRSMDRVERKRKKGKQNGLVGSKKRRNHK
jgi:AdoMet-dependent rRNA methyltransferase SPB1